MGTLLSSAESLWEAVWIVSDEFEDVTLWERWISAHASQPFGKPLHTHEGYLSLSNGSLRFLTAKREPLWTIPRDSLLEISVGYDTRFRRFRDSRGLLPPMRITTPNKTIYLFTKPPRELIFRGENDAILAWFQSRPRDG
ncbi:MAG: hypothetical protein M1126_04685 [Candidatus Thermoplasmatota archaeon]|jgi:hypothetical protein|nr:hypothetical protein [Candidatus Thermoplasmatota archaeon]